MTRMSYARAVDGVLSPLGFVQVELPGREKAWRREVDGCRDLVSLQISQFAGVTANLSTFNLETLAIFDAAMPPGTPIFPAPTTVRIGTLVDGRDRWWRKDPKGPKELADLLSVHAPLFFSSLRSLEAQADRYGRKATRWSRPYTRMLLAITLSRMGERQEACAALASPPKMMPAVWLPRLEAVRRHLGCCSGEHP